MKILVVQDGNWAKKGPHNQHHLMERLSLRGHEVAVVGYDQLWRQESDGIVSHRMAVNEMARFYSNAKIRYVRARILRIPYLDYFSYLFSCRKEIKLLLSSYEPDVVVGFTSIISSFWGLKLAKKRRIPFIYYWTDVTHTLLPAKILQPVAKLLETHISLKADAVVTTNYGLRDYVLKLGVDDRRLTIVPGGVDFDHFDPKKYDRLKTRSSLGISSGELMLFFMGWLYDFSGLKEVASEIAKLPDKDKKVKMLVVGEGDYFEELEAFVKSQGMESRIILMGVKPYSQIPELINASDICILPAIKREIMEHIVPIKMYEYLAMSKPVISTRLNGVQKEFGEGHGVVYAEEPEDVVKVALEMNEEELDRIGRSGGEFINKFNWESITDEFECLLNRVTQESEIFENPSDHSTL
jgi:glycosyltransferase involved in cell wall biosynthesis